MKPEALDRSLFFARFPALEKVAARVRVVGGAIRDLILDRPILDVDLVAPSPEEARRVATDLGSKVVELGRDIVTWRVVIGDSVYDVAPLQGETIEADLGRRDFTINAMSFDPAREILEDPFGGAKDCDSRVVRMISESNLVDDPLRVLRSVRFAATLGFSIEDKTAEACRRLAPRLDSVATERIAHELRLSLLAGDPPGFSEAFCMTGVGTALGLDCEAVPREFEGSSASFLGTWLLNLDEDSQSELLSLISPGRTELAKAAPAARLVAKLREEISRERIWRAGEDLTLVAFEISRESGLRALTRFLGKVLHTEGFFQTEPILNGSEIQEVTGIPPGPRVGEIGSRLMELQLKGDLVTRDEAVALAVELAGEA